MTFASGGCCQLIGFDLWLIEPWLQTACGWADESKYTSA